MSESSLSSRLTRRGLLAAGGAAGLGALLTACGSSGSSASGSGGGGGWAFTDDRKKKVTTDARPERIVAFVGTAAALHDFGVDEQIVGVFGPTKKKNGEADVQAGDLDIDRLEIIGNAYGEFNIEKYAKVRPDLLITNMYEPDALWFVPEESKKKIAKFAPSVAVTSSRVSLLEPIKRYAALAEALGADPKAKKVTDAKKRFEEASERLRKAAKKGGKPIKVMAASGSADHFYVSNPKINSDLMYFLDLGVDLVQPEKLEAGGYFEALSWENAAKYKADVIILDNRTQTLQPDALKSKATWSDLPAVKAGQVTPWMSEPRFSYAGAAPLIEQLADSIEGAKKVI